ncbi:MAG: hypothetical protein H6737_31340 [Alphaproteobacteria bacterium]|nr:hypothetical protein [Alphaproteobacteria bacterium]
MEPEADDPWAAPLADPMENPVPALLGFAAVMVLHVAFGIGSANGGFWLWTNAFGLLQLVFLVPLVALMVWRRAPRAAVVGVFFGAALAFVVNVVLVALRGLGASLV